MKKILTIFGIVVYIGVIVIDLISELIYKLRRR